MMDDKDFGRQKSKQKKNGKTIIIHNNTVEKPVVISQLITGNTDSEEIRRCITGALKRSVQALSAKSERQHLTTEEMRILNQASDAYTKIRKLEIAEEDRTKMDAMSDEDLEKQFRTILTQMEQRRSATEEPEEEQ